MDINITSQIISNEASIYAALEKLNQSNIRTLFVVDSSQSLIGSLTDGDIRRALLRGVKTEDLCILAMNKETCHIHHLATADQKDILTIPNDIIDIPVIDDDGRIQNIVRRRDLSTHSGLCCSFIFAGGRGTRLLPLTRTTPKPMLMLGNKPILQHIIEQHVCSGIKDIYISVNYLGDQICNYFGDGTNYNCRISYVFEGTALGTAGSLSLIPDHECRDILITNGDVVTNLSFSSLWDFHTAHANDGTVCIRKKQVAIPFGVISSTKTGELIQIEEKPTFSYDVNAGIYLLSPTIYRLVGKQEYLDMPDLLNRASLSSSTVNLFPIYEDWYDIGRHETLQEVRDSYN